MFSKDKKQTNKKLNVFNLLVIFIFAIFSFSFITFTNSYAEEQSLSQVDSSNGVDAARCEISGGFGWAVCPITRFLASGMDVVYSVISNFLEVQPLNLTETNNPTYQIWEAVRNIANMFFVIAFIIIVITYLTRYDGNLVTIKSVVPKLIVAAILVNLSYIISATSIDISNILGHGTYDAVTDIRKNLSIQNNTVTASSLSNFILTGGIAGAAGFKAFTAVGAAGGIKGLIFLLLPALVGAIIAILIALLILAIRQALIPLLVILSPLAFAMMLFPNTEKFFDKWKDWFISLLVFYPMFSLIFAVSQLAGLAMIATAASTVGLIIGLLVQVLPLAITPFILKFSSGTMNAVATFLTDPKRVGRIFNDPNKGPIDRTRNFANRRIKEITTDNLTRKPKWQQFAVRYQQAMDHRNRLHDATLSANKQKAEAYWKSTDKGQFAMNSVEAANIVNQLAAEKAQYKYNNSPEYKELQKARTSEELQKYQNINAALTQATNSKTRDYATAHPIPRDVNKSELKAALDRAKVPEEEMAKFFSPKQSTEQKASAKEVAKEMKETVTKTESIEVPLRNDKKEIISEKLSGSTSLSDKKKMDAINKAKNPKKPNN